jgi:hypothetical protein
MGGRFDSIGKFQLNCAGARLCEPQQLPQLDTRKSLPASAVRRFCESQTRGPAPERGSVPQPQLLLDQNKVAGRLYCTAPQLIMYSVKSPTSLRA